MQLAGRAEPLFDVGGVWVSGSHAVRDPRDGLWRRVQHAGRPLNTTAPVLWNVISEVTARRVCERERERERDHVQLDLCTSMAVLWNVISEVTARRGA